MKLTAHKIILYYCLIPAVVYTLLYELVFTEYGAYNQIIYKLGIITSRIFYSMLASSIFYFVSQYIPIYLPRQEKKEKILSNIRTKHKILEGLLITFQGNMKIRKEEYLDKMLLSDKLTDFDIHSKIESFDDFEKYYSAFRSECLDLIESILFYHDFLSLKYLNELQEIEKNFRMPKLFDYINYNLTGEIYFNVGIAIPTIQNILISKDKLKDLYQSELMK